MPLPLTRSGSAQNINAHMDLKEVAAAEKQKKAHAELAASITAAAPLEVELAALPSAKHEALLLPQLKPLLLQCALARGGAPKKSWKKEKIVSMIVELPAPAAPVPAAPVLALAPAVASPAPASPKAARTPTHTPTTKKRKAPAPPKAARRSTRKRS